MMLAQTASRHSGGIIPPPRTTAGKAWRSLALRGTRNRIGSLRGITGVSVRAASGNGVETTLRSRSGGGLSGVTDSRATLSSRASCPRVNLRLFGACPPDKAWSYPTASLRSASGDRESRIPLRANLPRSNAAYRPDSAPRPSPMSLRVARPA